jgi:hypothetical protein
MKKKLNYLYSISGSNQPCESATTILAYIYWEKNGKPEGRDLEFYYTAETFLTYLADFNYKEFLKVIFTLRGEEEKAKICERKDWGNNNQLTEAESNNI